MAGAIGRSVGYGVGLAVGYWAAKIGQDWTALLLSFCIFALASVLLAYLERKGA